MALGGLTRASGHRILKGKSGRVYKSPAGEVVFRRAPQTGIDQNLFGVLKAVADHLQLAMVVSSVDTGTHAPNSRHYKGDAADIARLAHIGHDPEPTHWPDAIADELVAYLHACGFKPYEGGDWPCVLWGAPHTPGNRTAIDHRDHVHISVSPHVAPGDEATPDPSPSIASSSPGGSP